MIASSSRPIERERRIRVVTADRQPLFQDSLERALERRPRIELVSPVGDADALLTVIEEARPDVAIVDDSLLDLERVGVLATRVVLLAGAAASARAFDAIERGAAGYVCRDSDADALHDAIVRVAAGETVIDGRLQAGVAREVRLRSADARPVLSTREGEVLRSIAKGRSAPQIAGDLHIGTGTVKTHLLHLYDKLGVGERAAAVAVAMRQGLLE